MPSQTGSIDLTAQVQARENAVSTAAADATSKANDAAKTATNYIYADSTGIRIANANPNSSNTYQHQTATETEFVVDGVSMAEISGDGARFGNESSTHLELTSSSIYGVSSNNARYLNINTTGSARIVQINSSHEALYNIGSNPKRERLYINRMFENATKHPTINTTITINASVSYIMDPDDPEAISFFRNSTTIIYGTTSNFVISGMVVLDNCTGSYDGEDDIELNIKGRDDQVKDIYIWLTFTETIPTPMFVFGSGQATGSFAISEGSSTASGSYSHAEGDHTEASGVYSHAEGNQTIASGDRSHVEGYANEASGADSHAEGTFTKASNDCSHAEGDFTEASGSTSHAEGSHTKASGALSHTEGSYTEASGWMSHAEGEETIASGSNSHVGGVQSEAAGEGSFVHGLGLHGSTNYGTIVGRNNLALQTDDYAFVIGNGHYFNTDSDKSNAFTVDWDGNAEFHTKDYSQESNDDKTIINGGNITQVYTGAVADQPYLYQYFRDKSNNFSAPWLRLYPGDRYGSGVVLGCAGRTIIGAGESAHNLRDVLTDNGQNDSIEQMYVASDNCVYIVPNCQTIANRVTYTFSNAGITAPGFIVLRHSTIDRDGEAPSSNQWSTDVGNGARFQMNDKDANALFYIRAVRKTDELIGMDLRVWNDNTSGSGSVSGGLQIYVAKDGTTTYLMNNPANFRNALGASSGVFPVSVGGTGITSNPSMLTNLGSTSAASVFAASPRPGVTGTLPRANGGTGVTGRTSTAVTRSNMTSDGTFYMYSNGVTCSVICTNAKTSVAIANGSSIQIGTISANKPPMNVPCIAGSSNSTFTGKLFVSIHSDGTIHMFNRSGSNFAADTSTFHFHGTWAL